MPRSGVMIPSAEIPPRLLRKPQKIAIDFQDRPYYGKVTQEQAKGVRGRAKDGATRFFRIATAYPSGAAPEPGVRAASSGSAGEHVSMTDLVWEFLMVNS